MRFLALLMMLVLFPIPAFAQSAEVVTIPPGDDRISAVRKGDPAPYDGQVFDSATALRWANWLQQYKLRLRIDVEKEQEICEAEVGYQKKILQVERKRANTVEKDLRDRLVRSEKARLIAEEEARNPPWYRSTWFGVGLGVLGTSALVGLSVWTLQATR